MSKNALYLVVVCALALTSLSFLISKSSGVQTCSVNAAISGDDVATVDGGMTAQAANAKEVNATVRGYPYAYYQEPFPANCISTTSTSSLSGLSMNHLGADLLIWLLAALACTLGMAGFKAWRGPRMLGDNVRRA